MRRSNFLRQFLTVRHVLREERQKEGIFRGLHAHDERGIQVVVVLEAEFFHGIRHLAGVVLDGERLRMCSEQVFVVRVRLHHLFHEFSVARGRIERVDRLARVVQQAEYAGRVVAFDQIHDNFIVEELDVFPLPI